MLSDRIFDRSAGLLKDMAQYLVDDAKHAEEKPEFGGFSWYDEETYVDTLKSIIPLKHVQFCLDTGNDTDLMLTDSLKAHHEWALTVELIEIFLEEFRKATNAKSDLEYPDSEFA